MKIPFVKYQGAGNDFILMDNRKGIIKDPKVVWISKLCDRRFGIGADGLLLLQHRSDFDFEMINYNADGQLATMCANGGRCIAVFAKKIGIIDQKATFLAIDGPHQVNITESGDWVSLAMIDVNDIQRDGDAFLLNTGSPHYVTCVNDLKHKNVYEEGKMIRNSPTYLSEGINVNFVEDMRDYYFVRTYERGVEDETPSCGTGITAVAMAMAKKKEQRGVINTLIHALGGHLKVGFEYDGNRFSKVFLEGPATFVFEGMIEGD